ncbi:MAG: M67 family metallopeptidase [Meiothermus sp.]|nr:M67 family metallopeptidase [Meiothermus sp.]
MLRVPQDCLEQTLSHLRAALPREGVGLWVGQRGWVKQVWPLENVHPAPHERYQADGQALVEVLRHIEKEGLELVAIYHSHPRGPARPSETDRSQAFWRVPYVIFDMQTGEVRAYRLPEGDQVVIQHEDAVGCEP